jgi:hypothetical protein
MSVKFSNNAVTTLSAGISVGATSFNVSSASLFPTLASGDWTYVSLTSEVVKVTAISGTTFTCDATSAAHASGESVELRMTAELLNDFAEDTEALPKTGGAMTGAITTNSTFDGRDVATDGTKLDTIATSANNYSHPANHAISVTTGLQAALDSKAPLASPALTGVPTAPTAAANTNTTQVATTAYVQTELTDLIGGAPSTLDTLTELATAIDNDSSYASTLTTALATKTAKTSNQSLSTAANALTISGHTITLARGDSTTDTVTVPDNNTTYSVGDGGLSEINFTSADHSKLNGIEAGATADQTAAQIKTLLENGIDSIHYVDGSIDRVHLAADIIDGTKIANDVINSEHYVAGSIDNEHIADNAINSEHYADNSIDALHLNVSGNGTTSQYLRSDGDGTMSWVTPPDTNTNTTYTADGNYGMTLSGTAFRLEDDRRRNSSTADIYSGNTHDYTFYDASHGIRWYTAGSEEMRLENDGDLHVDGDVIAYSTTVSDERLKTGITTVTGALDKVKQIRGVEFTRKNNGQRGAGVIAQELEKVLPQAIRETALPLQTGDETTLYKTVEYDALHALLIEAVKELSIKIEKLENK